LSTANNSINTNAMVADLSESQRRDWEILRKRILVLNERAWDSRLNWPIVEQWLGNFDGTSSIEIPTERLHALYLLSQMMYFGGKEIRVLLRALYSELVYIPIVQKARKDLGGSREKHNIEAAVSNELKTTRFLGVGNPSESGVHLLYYFRQENRIPKDFFLDSARIFSRESVDGEIRTVLAEKDVRRYIFIDDLCGSGETAEKYSKDLLPRILELNPVAEIYYFSLFATTSGMTRVRTQSLFGKNCGSVFELDESYKCLTDESRYFSAMPASLDREILRKINNHYGNKVCPGNGNGFEDGQLLLAFSHNTPDNTLPIIWRDLENGSPVSWYSALKRYAKF